MYINNPTVIIRDIPDQVINIPTVNPEVRNKDNLSPFFKVKESIINATIENTILSIIRFF